MTLAIHVLPSAACVVDGEIVGSWVEFDVAQCCFCDGEKVCQSVAEKLRGTSEFTGCLVVAQDRRGDVHAQVLV